MSAHIPQKIGSFVLSVNVSGGGIPKRPTTSATALTHGLEGDGRNHAKHIRPDRAVSVWDYEMLRQIAGEGFPSLAPGVAGENLTVMNLHLHAMPVGTLLRIGDAVLKVEQSRKPCYVLDTIDPRLKDVVVGRFGYLASVVQEGTIRPGMPIEVISATETAVTPAGDSIDVLPGSRAYHLLAGPTIG